MHLNLSELMTSGEPLRLTWGAKTFDCLVVMIEQDRDGYSDASGHAVPSPEGATLIESGKLRVVFQPTGPPR